MNEYIPNFTGETEPQESIDEYNSKVKSWESNKEVVLKVATIESQRQAEIMRSKALVSKLKAQGLTIQALRRKRCDNESNLNNNVSNNSRSSSPISSVSTSSSSIISEPVDPLSQAMTSLSTLMSKLAHGLYELRLLCHKDSKTKDYSRGYQLGMKILRGIEALVEIRDLVEDCNKESLLTIPQVEVPFAFVKKFGGKYKSKPIRERKKEKSPLERVERGMMSLFSQLLFYLSSCALETGEYAMVADLSRGYLNAHTLSEVKAEPKLISKTTNDKNKNTSYEASQNAANMARMWVLRAMSFAAMGNAFLTYRHLYPISDQPTGFVSTSEKHQSARRAGSYPGADDALKYVEERLVEDAQRSEMAASIASTNTRNLPTYITKVIKYKSIDNEDMCVMNENRGIGQKEQRVVKEASVWGWIRNKVWGDSNSDSVLLDSSPQQVQRKMEYEAIPLFNCRKVDRRAAVEVFNLIDELHRVVRVAKNRTRKDDIYDSDSNRDGLTDVLAGVRAHLPRREVGDALQTILASSSNTRRDLDKHDTSVMQLHLDEAEEEDIDVNSEQSEIDPDASKTQEFVTTQLYVELSESVFALLDTYSSNTSRAQLLRRTWTEALALYSESLYLHAEAKFTLCLLLLKLSKDEEKRDAMECVCLCNLGLSRMIRKSSADTNGLVNTSALISLVSSVGTTHNVNDITTDMGVKIDIGRNESTMALTVNGYHTLIRSNTASMEVDLKNCLDFTVFTLHASSVLLLETASSLFLYPTQIENNTHIPMSVMIAVNIREAEMLLRLRLHDGARECLLRVNNLIMALPPDVDLDDHAIDSHTGNTATGGVYMGPEDRGMFAAIWSDGVEVPALQFSTRQDQDSDNTTGISIDVEAEVGGGVYRLDRKERPSAKKSDVENMLNNINERIDASQKRYGE